jgi:arsenate reductase (glutaredoxin)
MVTIYHNQACSKSIGVLAMLEEKGIPVTVIHYLETPPTADELRLILSALKMEAAALVRKNEPVYKKYFEGKVLTNDEWIEAMLLYPVLIERPIVMSERGVVVARPAENVLAILE